MNSIVTVLQAPLQLVPEPPFFEQALGQLQFHHRLAEFGASSKELALHRIPAAPLQPLRSALQKHPTPLLELVRRNLHLTAHFAEFLATQKTKNYFCLQP